jgi:TFIIF-interacting CTD phosphatase-like protein
VKLNRGKILKFLTNFLDEKGKVKKLLLLDLDETLVHSENFMENTPYDFIVDFMDYKGKALDVRNILTILILTF